MSESTPIILVRQKHDAKRAGLHYDIRMVVDDKAFSWASKKEMPVPGAPTMIFEQPVHDASYALSKKIEIPDGQYGAGTTTLDFAQKGVVKGTDSEYHLDLTNGDRYLLKKMTSDKYGVGAWLFLKKRPKDMTNPYLVKAAALGNKDRDEAVAKILKDHPHLNKEDLHKEFVDRRSVAGRVVGGVLGGVVPVLGNIAGYYVGKSYDNSKANLALRDAHSK